jgi:hypothetical protein
MSHCTCPEEVEHAFMWLANRAGSVDTPAALARLCTSVDAVMDLGHQITMSDAVCVLRWCRQVMQIESDVLESVAALDTPDAARHLSGLGYRMVDLMTILWPLVADAQEEVVPATISTAYA